MTNSVTPEQRLAYSKIAKNLISQGILKAVELFEASYDQAAATDAVCAARNSELNGRQPCLINFTDFYRKSLHEACLEADTTLSEILFTMLDNNWNGAIEMAEECIDDGSVKS